MRQLAMTLVLLALAGCPPPKKNDAGPVVADAGPGTGLFFSNRQAGNVEVYLAFGSDSQILPTAWSFCTATAPLNCHFTLAGTTSRSMPNPGGQYLNATVSFGAPAGCGTTKAELNINNPAWYDTLDVSLVDGYSNKVEIVYTPPAGSAVTLGPPNGQTGNEKVLGVFPYGCDVCVARQAPPCGIPTGTEGCKGGTQYDPVPVCQVQGAVKGGGGTAEVVLL